MVNEKFEIRPIKLEKGNSSVYNINYHIVFCPKYRKKVLNGKVKEDIDLIFRAIANFNSWIVRNLKIMPDNIHLFITAPPIESPIKIVKKLKGISARTIFKKYPELEKKNFGEDTFGVEGITLERQELLQQKQYKNISKPINLMFENLSFLGWNL